MFINNINDNLLLRDQLFSGLSATKEGKFTPEEALLHLQKKFKAEKSFLTFSSETH